jgi:hypothetical protein
MLKEVLLFPSIKRKIVIRTYLDVRRQSSYSNYERKDAGNPPSIYTTFYLLRFSLAILDDRSP